MATEKLKINYKIKNKYPGPIHKLKTIKTAMNSMNSDWSDHKHNIKNQNTHI